MLQPDPPPLPPPSLRPANLLLQPTFRGYVCMSWFLVDLQSVDPVKLLVVAVIDILSRELWFVKKL